MPKRGENIHKRKDGRWEGRIKKKNVSTDKLQYSSVYGKSYSEVKEKVLQEKIKIYLSDEMNSSNYKFSQVLNMWFRVNRLKFKGATEHKYDYLIQHHILPDLGELNISDITVLVLQDFMEQKLESGRLDKKGGLSKSYVRVIMIIILSALRYAVAENLCEPLKTTIYKPSIEKKELQIFSLNEQKAFEAYLLQNLTPSNLGILLSLFAGLRIGEVCALKWEDIDLQNQIIHIRSTVTRVKNPDNNSDVKTLTLIDIPKTKASIRDIPIHSSLTSILANMKRNPLSMYVVSEDNSFLCPRTYEYRYHQALKKSGINKYNYHMLRHTFATRCIEAGMDVKTLSELLGHANVSITLNTYVHSSMEQKRKQMEKLPMLSC